MVEYNKTFLEYLNRKAPTRITPTFRNVKSFIKGRTLDIGMGTGEYLEKFPKGSIGVDISRINLEINKRKGLIAILADINESLPFVDNSFGTVFCSHVIEHVDSPIYLLREAKRVLKIGGNIILAIPIEKTIVRLIREGYFKDHKTHLYGLSVDCVNRLLKQVGLQVIKKYFNFPLLSKISIIDKMLQYISSNYCEYFCTMYWIVSKK